MERPQSESESEPSLTMNRLCSSNLNTNGAMGSRSTLIRSITLSVNGL